VIRPEHVAGTDEIQDGRLPGIGQHGTEECLLSADHQTGADRQPRIRLTAADISVDVLIRHESHATSYLSQQATAASAQWAAERTASGLGSRLGKELVAVGQARVGARDELGVLDDCVGGIEAPAVHDNDG
jgi:hypothetical protein